MEFQTTWSPKPLKSTVPALVIFGESQGKQKMCETFKMTLSQLGLDRVLRTKKKIFHFVPLEVGWGSPVSMKQAPLVKHIL